MVHKPKPKMPFLRPEQLRNLKPEDIRKIIEEIRKHHPSPSMPRKPMPPVVPHHPHHEHKPPHHLPESALIGPPKPRPSKPSTHKAPAPHAAKPVTATARIHVERKLRRPEKPKGLVSIPKPIVTPHGFMNIREFLKHPPSPSPAMPRRPMPIKPMPRPKPEPEPESKVVTQAEEVKKPHVTEVPPAKPKQPAPTAKPKPEAPHPPGIVHIPEPQHPQMTSPEYFFIQSRGAKGGGGREYPHPIPGPPPPYHPGKKEKEEKEKQKYEEKQKKKGGEVMASTGTWNIKNIDTSKLIQLGILGYLVARSGSGFLLGLALGYYIGKHGIPESIKKEIQSIKKEIPSINKFPALTR